MKTRECAGLCFSDENERQSFFIEEIVIHEKLVRSVISKILSNPADIDDAMQDAFLIAWTSMDSLKNRDALTSWLCAIARNAALDIFRENSRLTVGISETVSDSESVEIHKGEALVSRLPGPEEMAMAKLRQAQLELAFRMLPLQYRMHLYLRCYLELEAGEINRILGIEEHTRRNAYFRARQAVKRNFQRLENR